MIINAIKNKNLTRSKNTIRSCAICVMLILSPFAVSATTETKPSSLFKLFDFSDKSVQFKNYITAKQWTVVMFWASDCHVCNVEASQFVKLHTQNQDKNIRVLGVSVDGASKKTEAQEFINKHNINFPNLIGEPELIANLYFHYTQESWLGTPTFMIFSPAGVLKAQRPGMLPTKLIVGFINGQTEDSQQ